MFRIGDFLRLLAIGAMICLAPPCWAEEPPFQMYTVEKHEFDSAILGQKFIISVQLPVRLKDGSERFPALYVPDAVNGPSFEVENFFMQWGADVPRFITVSIGYPTWAEWQLRSRNFTPTEDGPLKTYDDHIEFGSVSLDGRKSGGAAEFLKFIRNELKPFVDANYPTIPTDNSYFGDSLGGLFGLFVLLNEPDTFDRYILGSPSIWWGDRVLLRQAEEFIASGKTVNARVFMGVGGRERETMISNMFEMKRLISQVDGLEIETYVFPDESHTSVMPMNYVRGVKWAYGKPEMDFVKAYKQSVEIRAREGAN